MNNFPRCRPLERLPPTERQRISRLLDLASYHFLLDRSDRPRTICSSQFRIDDRQRVPSSDEFHVSDPEQCAKLLRGHLHRPRRFSLAGLRLGKRGGSGRVKGNGAFHLLHGLVNMAVQYSHGSESLQIAQCLRAIVCSPTPLRIYGPQRNVREDNDGNAGCQWFQIQFQPLQLVELQGTRVLRPSGSSR